MAEETPGIPASTFIVRFWQEWSASGPSWRGRISHVQSGDSAIFFHLSELLAFICGLGIMTDDEAKTGVRSSRDGDEDPR